MRSLPYIFTFYTKAVLTWCFIYIFFFLGSLKLRGKMVPRIFSNLLDTLSRWNRVWQ